MIEVEDLCFRYARQAADTLKHLDFRVRPGEVFGFLGPSGSGKSTTQRLLIGLEKGHRGRIRLFDRPIEHWDARLYARIGVSFELPNHYRQLTGRENLAVFAALHGMTGNARIEAVLDQVGLLDAADQRTRDYSKGMLMRLNLARALLPDPDLLFLDEPTSGLDPVTARRIKALIQQQQARGKTAFLTTHNMHDAEQLCDRVAFIVDGELKHVDSPAAMMQRYGQATLCVDYRDRGKPRQQVFEMDDLAENPEFQRLLKSRSIERMHSQEASLDDVFIKVTGARLS